MISAVILLFLLMKTGDKVEKYVKAISVWMLFCFVITEALSVFQMISTLNLWICWIGFDVVLALLNISKYKKDGWKQISDFAFPRSINKKMLIWGIFALGMICLALKTVPYNWDSMTYHMPRIFHWYQNGSVAHYATHIDRQVASPVLGAFVNLHVYAMAGGNDIFVNLLQCLSFLTNGILVYFIAKKINCSEKYCTMAAVLFYSMPIAFAEAFTTQVDNFSALWMLGFAYLLIDLLDVKEKIAFDRKTVSKVSHLALCVAYGYLAKPSVGFSMVFFAVWLLVIVIRRRDKVLTLVAYIAIAAVILVAVLSPEFYRNINTYNALSSPGTGQRQLVGTLHERYIAVNTVKNFTFNMPTVWVYNSSEIIWKYTMRLARVLGVDIDDPAISEDGREFEVRAPQTYGHSSAVNPLVVWLLVICAFLWLFKNRKRRLSEVRNQYFIVAGISFVFFCAVLRWEPFVSRYMLSYLALLCPAVVSQLEMFFEGKDEKHYRNELIFVTVFYFLCITEFWGLLYYHGKIALSQTDSEGYFASRREITENYLCITNAVNGNGYEDIGLIIGKDSYEYPLMVMLEDYDSIKHVNVNNSTAGLEEQGFVPDIILVIDCDLPKERLMCHNHEYEITEQIAENIYIFKKCTD